MNASGDVMVAFARALYEVAWVKQDVLARRLLLKLRLSLVL